MNTNIVFDAGGYYSGLDVVLSGFRAMLDDFWNTTFIGDLVSALSVIVTIVLLWYGVRAILRAVKASK